MSQHVTRGAHPAWAAPRNSLLGMCPFTSAQVPKSSWQLVAFFQPTDSLGRACRAQKCCRDSSAQKLYTKIILKQKGITWRARSSFCAHMWCSHDTSGICRQVSDSTMSLLDYLFNPQNNLRREKPRWLPSVSVLPETNSGAVSSRYPCDYAEWRWSRTMIAITRCPGQWKTSSSLWAAFCRDCVSLCPWISISQVRHRLRCPGSHSLSGLG